MQIAAKIRNSKGKHSIQVKTNDNTQSIAISPRLSGYGSSVNGGELLFLALATCYCNDIYREAVKRNITVERVEVEVDGEFGGEGEPAKNIRYRATVVANGSDEQTLDLMRETDKLAEIQNSLRKGIPVTFIPPSVTQV